MTAPNLWLRIPEELRSRKQWAIAAPDKEPMVQGSDGNLYRVSVNDVDRWMDFEAAATAAQQNNLHIGYIVHETDPFTCIDLDVKDAANEPDPTRWTTQEQFDRYWSIVQQFASYTERSRSGKGLHIWVRGKIGKGRKRDGVELYSQQRFLITTGDTINGFPIVEKQDLLTAMASQMAPPDDRSVELEEIEAEEDDWSILLTAMNAANSEKYLDLYRGEWQKHGFPSQSEADLALMSIFTFYSKSNEQCRRLFRDSALGKREKAQKDNRYLDYTLKVIRARQKREAQVDHSAILQSAELVAQMRKAPDALHVPGKDNDEPTMAPVAASMVVAGPSTLPKVEAKPEEGTGSRELDWPPGLTGAIAGFIYQSAPRPVKEVAIMSALGLLAGICGKAWFIPQSGLNLYGILVARSAVGKEAMNSGVSALMASVASRQPAVMQFVDFNDFASGPALVKAVAANPSFVNIAGEWGRKLKRLAQENGRDAAMEGLRTVMTNLYQKSGPQSIVGGITYSSKDNNIASVSGVAYSMIGETTPSTFYESLTESMMEDGFLSRFLIMEYGGKRPPLNHAPLREPSKALGDAVADLCTQALTLLSRRECVPVGCTSEAAAMFAEFEEECDTEINKTVDESWRQMWNRASLKMMRLAALLAVADNWYHPVIEPRHVTWALDVVRRNIQLIARKLETGDVGTSDDARERKVLAIIREYLRDVISEGYKVPDTLRQNGIVPRKLLQQRTARITSFVNHRMGSTGCLNLAIQSLIDSGYIMEVNRDKMVEAYNFHGKCYRVLSLPESRLSK